MHTPIAALVLFAACAAGEASAADPPRATASGAFWAHWGDGRAELNGYSLVTPRYGEIRQGTATLVFVTETFTEATRVKSDGGHDDEYPVFKLNRIWDYQTGIYDYNAMTSAFLRIDGEAPLGQPVKVSLSMQEWCGHIYEQILPRGNDVEWTAHSYFDGEADRATRYPNPEDGVFLDALPILVRGLVGELPTGSMPAFPTLVSGRYAHVAPTWSRLTVTRDAKPRPRTVPAGTFDVVTVTTAIDRGPTTTWSVEAAPPHRLVGWSSTDGEVAELLGSERIPYWNEHQEGGEKLLEKLGLPVPSP